MSEIERAIEKKEYIERGAIINFKSSKQEHPLDDKTKYFAVFIEKDGEIAHASLIMGWILCNWIKRGYYREILFVLADKFKNAVTEGIPAADVEPVVRCEKCKYGLPLDPHCELNEAAYLQCAIGRGEETLNVWHKYKKYYRNYSLVDRNGFCDQGEEGDPVGALMDERSEGE